VRETVSERVRKGKRIRDIPTYILGYFIVVLTHTHTLTYKKEDAYAKSRKTSEQ